MHYEEYAVAGGAPLKKALRFYGDACRLDPYRFCVARAYAKGETVTIDRARAEDFYRQS